MWMVLVLIVCSVLLSYNPVNGADLEKKERVVFVCNAESGLSNICLAVCQSLTHRHPDVDVHFVSYARLEKAVATIADHESRPITFHALSGPTMFDCMTRQGVVIDTMVHSPDMDGHKQSLDTIETVLLPWTGEEYVETYREVLNILSTINASIAVLETQMHQGLDAVSALNIKHVLLSPNSIKDVFVSYQPWAAMLWKYPALGSAHPFPVPWRSIPNNIFMNIRLIYRIVRSKSVSKKTTYIKNHGILMSDLFQPYREGIPWISASIPEIEFPLSVIPRDVIGAGPVYLSSAPAEVQSPELAAWLSRAPTVLVNLGSLFTYNETDSIEMAGAIKELLTESDVQVLWKFNKRHPYSDDFLNPIAKYLHDRVRLEKWLDADPPSLLESGHVILSVHHGGANCFHEAVATGIPAVILPLWVDHYDFAIRAEWLGIGLWGSQRTAPKWTSEELGETLLKAVHGQFAESLRTRAKEVAMLTKRAPGRDGAADTIINYMRKGGVQDEETTKGEL